MTWGVWLKLGEAAKSTRMSTSLSSDASFRATEPNSRKDVTLSPLATSEKVTPLRQSP